MIIEISVGVIAIAVVVLVVYLVKTLRMMQTTITQVNQVTQNLQADVHKVLSESEGLLKKAQELTEDIQGKSKQTDQLFVAVDQIGKQIQSISDSIGQQANEHKDRLGNAVAIVSAGIEIMKKWKNA